MPDVKKLVEEHIVHRLNQHPDVADDLGVLVGVSITGDGGGMWIIDCTKHPVTVHQGDKREAEVTIEMSSEDLAKLSKGELNAISAFMFGKIKVDGDIHKAVELGRMIR